MVFYFQTEIKEGDTSFRILVWIHNQEKDNCEDFYLDEINKIKNEYES